MHQSSPAISTPTHDELVEWVLEHSGATLTQMSQAFSKSCDWMRAVISTDAFKDVLARRRKEHAEEAKESLPTELGHVALDSLKLMRERMRIHALNPGAMPIDEVRKNAEMSLDALGMKQQAHPGTVPGGSAVTVVVTPHLLEAARERYNGRGAAAITLDHEPAPDAAQLPPGGQSALEPVRPAQPVPAADSAREASGSSSRDTL